MDDNGQTSAQSSPDLGSLTEFHQLILLRLLRPDRFPVAAGRYVAHHLTAVKALPSSIGSILGSAQRLLGVLVLLPPTPAFGNKQFSSNLKMKVKPVDVLRGVAQVSENSALLTDPSTSSRFSFPQTRIAIPRYLSQSYGAYLKYIVHVHDVCTYTYCKCLRDVNDILCHLKIRAI